MKPLIPLPALVIPDVHDSTVWAEFLIERYASDGRPVIFLGDYFDSEFGGPMEAHFTARWLQESLLKPNRFHLLGNHDASYFYFGHPQTRCSAWSEDKHRAMVDVLGDLRRVAARMHLALRVGPWLVSHAGYSGSQFRGAPTEALLSWANAAKEALEYGVRHPLLAVGKCRGGADKRGGILWCDFDHEFSNLAGVNQIVGHGSNAEIVRCRQLMDTGRMCYAEIYGAGSFRHWPYHIVGKPRATNWCIDAGMRACATIERERFVIHLDGHDIAFPAPSELDQVDEFPLMGNIGFEVEWNSVPPAYVAWDSLVLDDENVSWRDLLENFCRGRNDSPLGPSLFDVEYSLRKLGRMGWRGVSDL